MTQSALNLNAVNQGGKLAPQLLSTPTQELFVTTGGQKSVLNVSAITVIKSTAGKLAKVSVITAGAAGAVYDNNSTSTGNTAANQIGVIPATVGVYTFDWPTVNGITYVPGTSQVVSISYS